MSVGRLISPDRPNRRLNLEVPSMIAALFLIDYPETFFNIPDFAGLSAQDPNSVSHCR